MVISLICNAVSFISALVIFLNFRKMQRMYNQLRDRIYVLRKDYDDLLVRKDNLFWENEENLKKISVLEQTVKYMDSSSGMDTIKDYKAKVREVTESYDRQHNCRVRQLIMDRDRNILIEL